MLDSYNLRAVTERVTENVNVTEKRAPTDESVRLLREMESSAKKAIIDSTRVTDTPVEFVIHYERDCLNDSDKFRIVYSLKGRKRVVDYVHESWRNSDKREQRTAAATGLRDALANDIATMLVSAGLDAAMKPKYP